MGGRRSDNGTGREPSTPRLALGRQPGDDVLGDARTGPTSRWTPSRAGPAVSAHGLNRRDRRRRGHGDPRRDRLRVHAASSSDADTEVTLTATPNGASAFTGWSGGGCSGTGTCVVTMDQARSVTATFSSTNGVAQLAAGAVHTCALTSAGSVKCWGSNSEGQVGDGSINTRTTPVNVVGLSSGVTQVAAEGNRNLCTHDRWGREVLGIKLSGQLGDGTTNRTTPVEVVGLSSGVAVVAAGAFHTCALTSAGSVKCWGSNYSGPLGDGPTTNRSAPVDVVGLSSGVTQIAAGGNQTCALTTAGGVKCWGRGPSVPHRGQLGSTPPTGQPLSMWSGFQVGSRRSRREGTKPVRSRPPEA